MGQLEISLIAAWVGTHEGAFLTGLRRRPDKSRGYSGHTSHILNAPEDAMGVYSVLGTTEDGRCVVIALIARAMVALPFCPFH